MNAKRGGRRPGAGRPKSGRKPYTLMMKPATMRELRIQAQEDGGKSVGQYLEEIVQIFSDPKQLND